MDATYNQIFSIEMFKHMKNYKDLLKKISKWMGPDSLLFVHHLCHKVFAYHFEMSMKMTGLLGTSSLEEQCLQQIYFSIFRFADATLVLPKFEVAAYWKDSRCSARDGFNFKIVYEMVQIIGSKHENGAHICLAERSPQLKKILEALLVFFIFLVLLVRYNNETKYVVCLAIL